LSFVAALALAFLALAAYTTQGALAQDDVVVPISELNDSGVSGDASLTDNGDGTTTVDILVDGATGGHPAHIHSGTCADLGDVVYPLTDVDASGESVTVVDVPLADLLSGGPYAINVHLSADEIGTYVACGDVTQEVAAAQTAETAVAASPTAQASPTGVGGTESVTSIGTSGTGTTFGGNSSFLALAIGAIALLVMAGAYGLRRREQRG
jgi:hypothetical protein